MVVIRHYAPNAEGLVYLQKGCFVNAGSFEQSRRQGEAQCESSTVLTGN